MSLNKLENQIVSTVLSGNKVDLVRKLKLIEKKASFLKKDKDKKYIHECISKIKSKINIAKFSDSVIKTYQLKEAVEGFEDDALVSKIQYPDLSHVVKAKVEALPEDKAADGSLGTVFLHFKIILYPQGNTYADVWREQMRLKTKLSGLGPVVLNQLVRAPKLKERKWPLFAGTGIWESDMATAANKKGKHVECDVELSLDVTATSLEELRPEISKLLVEINDFVPLWFGDTSSSSAQQTSLEPIVSDEEETDVDAYYKPDTEFDVEEKEPTPAELKKLSKSLQLDSVQNRLKAALLKEKIEKLTGKKVILEKKEEQLSDVKVKKGKMHKVLGIPKDKEIHDVYKSGASLAKALVAKVGKEKAAGMINFAANINSAHNIFDAAQKALKSIKEGTLKEATGVQDTAIRIEGDLIKFLNSVVIPASKGYVKNERDAALLLYDILKNKYIIGMK